MQEMASSPGRVCLWQQGRIVPANKSLARLGSFIPLFKKSKIDRATTWPAAEGWSWALERGHTVPVGRSSAVAVWSRWAKSSVRLGSFGVLL